MNQRSGIEMLIRIYLLLALSPIVSHGLDYCTLFSTRRNASSSCLYHISTSNLTQEANHTYIKVRLERNSLHNGTSFFVFVTSSDTMGYGRGRFVGLPQYARSLDCNTSQFAGGFEANSSLHRMIFTWRMQGTGSSVVFRLLTTSDNSTCVKESRIINNIPAKYPPTTHQPQPKTKESCAKDHFMCGSGECILSSSVCNRKQDCHDASDETDQQCKASSESWTTWLRNAGVSVAVLVVMILFFYFLYKTYVRKQERKRAELPLLGHPSPKTNHVSGITISPSPLLGRPRPARSLMDLQRQEKPRETGVKYARSMIDVTDRSEMASKSPKTSFHGSAGNVAYKTGKSSPESSSTRARNDSFLSPLAKPNDKPHNGGGSNNYLSLPS
ncbi:uncharacterized protein LOC116612231 [Nematostella vectensis]|uniref:uncharacterized protein LOC116612231 n=1 Tax=Nematostella vectensis TaxID=45351 RepID=UPI0020775AB7|nr:uncharacterized protein LOC116612231 [Nematostella vectensis]